jgi:hypothetical protein
MSTLVLIHGAGDVGWYGHLGGAELSREAFASAKTSHLRGSGFSGGLLSFVVSSTDRVHEVLGLVEIAGGTVVEPAREKRGVRRRLHRHRRLSAERRGGRGSANRGRVATRSTFRPGLRLDGRWRGMGRSVRAPIPHAPRPCDWHACRGAVGACMTWGQRAR